MSVLVPKEVVSFYKDKLCPRCGSCLGDIDVLKGGMISGYYAITWCKSNCDHYQHVLLWEDPKYLEVDEESITIFDSEYEYDIKKFFRNEIFDTQIIISSLESKDRYDDSNYYFSNLKMNFKLSDKKLLSKIKTLMLFR